MGCFARLVSRKLFAMVVLLCSVCAASLLHAETLREVLFTGAERTALETLKTTVASKAGMQLSADLVRSDIQALFKLGQFSDVTADVAHVNGMAVLTYQLSEKPYIADIGFDGNRKLKSDDLQELSEVKTFRTLDENAVLTTIDKIKKKYAEKGYYLADVDYHLEDQSANQQKLIFDIHEHQGVFVRKVLFQGNDAFSDKELRGIIKTREKGMFAFMTQSGKYNQEQLNLDQMRLTYHYLNHGYFRAKVAPAKVTMSKDKRFIFVSFQVTEGKQYKFGEVTLSGDILTTHEELMSLLKAKSGKTYSQQTLDEDIMQLSDRYGDEGYAFASIVAQTEPDDENLTVKVKFEIEKGSRITIGHINISGNTVTRDKVIRRELEVIEGDRYSERNLRESKRKLMQLGFFEEINFATPRGKTDNTVDLNITVKEKHTGNFNIGIAFSTAENFIFTASVQKANFFGYGVSGSVSTELSSRRQLFSLSLQDPYFLDTKWIASMSLYHNAMLINDFRRTALGGSVGMGRRFLSNFTANLGYQIEDVAIGSFSSSIPQFFRERAGGLTSAVSFTLSHDTRDNRLAPSKGLYNVASTTLSDHRLGSDNEFFRTGYTSMLYQPIFSTFVFKQFGKIEYIKSLDDDPVPLFERYFTGGPNSLRGYFPNSVGPKIRIPRVPGGPDRDTTIGGDKMLIFVSEVEYKMIKNAGISLVGFFDAGNVFAEEQSYSMKKLKLDYGFGLRWNSPMGPLRFEWGIPINPSPGDDSVVFNFSIGDFF